MPAVLTPLPALYLQEKRDKWDQQPLPEGSQGDSESVEEDEDSDDDAGVAPPTAALANVQKQVKREKLRKKAFTSPQHVST